jgi:hypothetical protein
MITKEQFNRLLFVTTVYSAFAQIYSTLDESPLDELPDELKEDSIKLFRSFEDLLERYNDYLQHAVETSELPD